MLASMRACRAVFGALLAASWLAPTAALAQVELAVLPFEGAGAAATRREVTVALEHESRVRVADAASVDAAVARLGAESVPAIARELGARVLVEGTLSGRGARRRLLLRARDAAGRELSSARARIARGAAGHRAREIALRTLIDGALVSLGPEPSTTHPPDASSSSRGAPVVERDTASAGAPPRDAAAHAPDQRPEDGGLASAPPTDDGWGEDPALLTVSVSPALRSREAQIVLEDQTARGFSAGPFFELGARVELRPLAHERSYARGIYATLDAGGAIGLSAQGVGGANVGATFYRLALVAGYLVPIARLFEIGAGIGAGWDALQLATNGAMPTVEYPYLRAAVRARARLIGEGFVASVDGGYRALFGREGLSSAFGARGESFGWDVGAALSGTFDVGLSWALEASYTQYVHTFGGPPGFLGNGTRGTDSGYRFALSIGYALR